MSLVCSQSVNIKRTWTAGNNSVMQLKNALWHLGIYSSGLCITLSFSLMTWVETHSPFSAGPVCCKVLAMSGGNSHSSLLIFRDITIDLFCWDLEIFEPVAPRLLPKPRLTRCDSISRVQDSKGKILKPTPSALQGESTDQKEHFRSTAKPNALHKKGLLFFQLSVM